MAQNHGNLGVTRAQSKLKSTTNSLKTNKITQLRGIMNLEALKFDDNFKKN